MDYEYFEKLSPREAQEYFDNFLACERIALEQWTPVMQQAGLVVDYSLSSLPSILQWMLGTVHFRRVPIPDSEPDWIKQAYKDGLIEFDEMSRVVILRAAYYMGECFVRTYPFLRWAIGNREYMQKNMPVVTGFKYEKELAVAVVAMNVFSSVLQGGETTEFEDLIDVWRGYVTCPNTGRVG